MRTTTSTTTTLPSAVQSARCERRVRARLATCWAAVGAAIAVTLGAGGLHLADAAIGDGERPVVVPIPPCRLVDTRPGAVVGPRSTPLGPGEVATFAVHGTNGNCTIPTGASGVMANVTVVDPTSASYLTLFPAGTPQPTASNLNWVAGQDPTPNAVVVDLSDDGRVSVFNERGSVHLVVDLVGYVEDHHHDDRYYTEAESDARYATPESVADQLAAIPVGVKARGLVNANGTVSRSSNILSITRPGTGQTCVQLYGTAAVQSVAIATPEWDGGATGIGGNAPTTFVEVSADSSGCPINSIKVITGRQEPTGANPVATVDTDLGNYPFWIVVF